MAENREEVLANFQSIAAIDDVAEAILILDNCDWDLLAAINQVMPVDDHSGFNNLNRPPSVEIADNIPPPLAPVVNNFDRINNDIAGSSSSHSKPWQPRRTLQFHIQHSNNLIELEIPDTNTVGQLKNQLSPKVGIPVCRMILKNWPEGLKPLDETVLSTLELPEENILMLTDMQEFAPDDTEATNRLTQTYGLEIRNLDSDVCYSLNFPGTKTILEVKNDIYTLTDIPARHQCWTGWPRMSDLDSMMLCMAGLDYPLHKLTVKKSQPLQSNNKNNKVAGSTSSTNTNFNNTADLSQDSDNSSTAGDEFYEDASESFNIEDDTFIDQLTSRRSQPLIPEDVDDETIGSLHFSERYANRYGARHPTFYAGSLEDAMREACQKPAKDRKLLGVYLHHDKSVLSNVFCTQLLGFESVIDALSRHFVVYGWDFTNPNNRNLFLSSLSSCLNSQAAMQVRNIAVERLPAFVIIMRTRSLTELFTIVHGNVGVDELMTSILEAVEVFSEGVRSEIREEDERAARERVKHEQDEAYRESLEADRAKERERAQRERDERRERERVEAERERTHREKEERRERVRMQLPPEPSESGSGDGITKIRIRLPTGSFAERRFLITTELKVLMDYMIVLGYPIEEYKVISSWPRRDLTTVDPVSTFQELKLYPQETVIIEER